MIDEFKNLGIAGYPSYEINRRGDVISLKCKYGIERRRMCQRKDKQGYLHVHLSDNGKEKWVSVHRLVALAFIPNPLNLPQVNHKDEDKENNKVDNLEWCDAAYNSNYGTRNEKVIKALTGRPCSEETKRKIAVTRLGEKNPMKKDWVRKKNSEAHKGKLSPRKGVALSEETKRKISETKRANRAMKEQTLKLFDNE